MNRIKISLCFALFAVLLPLSSRAADWTYDSTEKSISDGNFKISVREKNKELTLVGITMMPLIPTGEPVVYHLDLSPKVVSTNGTEYCIVEIGKAFTFGHKGLTKVTLPGNDGALRTIGDSAFQDCIDLESVEPFLPDTVTKLGKSAFAGCSKLAGSVDLSNIGTLEANIFENTAIRAVNLPRATKIGKSAFSGCTALETVTPFLPESLMTLGENVFYNCRRLGGDLVLHNATEVPKNAFAFTDIDSAALPKVRTVSYWAFNTCPKLRKVSLPLLEKIEEAAFAHCLSLENMSHFFPNTLKAIKNNAFLDCPKLTGDLYVGNPALTTIPGNLFQDSPLRSVTFRNVQKIGKNAFANLQPGATVTFLGKAPDPKKIQHTAFYVQKGDINRIVIRGSLRLDPEGWKAFASIPVTDEDKALPDYPGEGTFGRVDDTENKNTPVKHWCVDYISPYEPYAPDTLTLEYR